MVDFKLISENKRMATKSKLSAQLQAKLRKAREKFAKAEPAESNSIVNRKVADGNYTAKLTSLEFDEFGKHAVIRFSYEVTDADLKQHETAIGEIVETRFSLDTDEGPSFAKRDFGRFGYDEMDDLLDNVDDAVELFEELLSLHPVCKINVAMDDTDQWQNVFLNDVLEMDEENEEEKKPKPAAKKEPAKTSTSKSKGSRRTKKEPEEPKEEPEEINDDTGNDVEEDDDGDEEGEELEVGSLVEVEYKGKEIAATVIAIDEENETVKVQIEKPKKRLTLPIDKIYILEG